MDYSYLISKIDHTVLGRDCRWEDVRRICDEGAEAGVASVCIPPAFVRQAVEYLGGKLPVCTVIGFPNGYSTTATKCFEASDALANGAEEIDMVINLTWVKDGRWDDIQNEIAALKAIAGEHVLKVIVETCVLTYEEKILLCRLVADAGADYIKTSTGFAGGGATVEDVALLRKCSPSTLKVKASGGVSALEDAEAMVKAGADRLGTSRLLKAILAVKD